MLLSNVEYHRVFISRAYRGSSALVFAALDIRLCTVSSQDPLLFFIILSCFAFSFFSTTQYSFLVHVSGYCSNFLEFTVGSAPFLIVS